jgi:aspartate carbamoyltransferase catalytic subunit
VLRYYKEGGAARAAKVASCNIISGGDGAGQHPTQALLDLFTIRDELGEIEGLSVGLAGDLKHGRTIHSLAYLLGKYKNVKLYFNAPNCLRMPENIKEHLERHNVEFVEADNLMEHIGALDVLYQTRLQKERFENLEEYDNSVGKIIVTRDVANSMKIDSIILHPLPRVSEIRFGVDDNHRAKYFEQAENGMYVRMALLNYLIGKR